MDKPMCYGSILMWSADGCSQCEHDMYCYNRFLNYMIRTREKREKNNEQKLI